MIFDMNPGKIFYDCNDCNDNETGDDGVTARIIKLRSGVNKDDGNHLMANASVAASDKNSSPVWFLKSSA